MPNIGHQSLGGVRRAPERDHGAAKGGHEREGKGHIEITMVVINDWEQGSDRVCSSLAPSLLLSVTKEAICEGLCVF